MTVNVGSSVVTNEPLWWGIVIWGGMCIILCDSRGGHGKSLYLLLYFAVNLEQFHKTETINKGILEPTPSMPGLMISVMYRCESWTIKKAEHPRIDAFELWC